MSSPRQLLRALLACSSLLGLGLTGCGHMNAKGAQAQWSPPSYYADEHYAELAGVNTCYLEAGPPDAEETIVFVHGWSGNVQNWWDQFELFKSRYRVIAFDAPGHGKSERGPHLDYSMHLHVEVLAALFEELELEEAIVVGNSGGGWTAANFAIEHPDKVSKLVLSDSTGSRTKGPAGAVLWMINAKWLERSQVTSGEHYPGLDPKSRERQEFAVSFDGTVEELPYLEALAQLLPPMYEVIPKQSLARIEAPTLIIWGDDDHVVPIRAMKAFDKGIPNSETYTVHLGGHTPMMNSPDEFNCAVASFLSGTDAAECAQYALDEELKRERLAGKDVGPHYH